MKDPYTAHEAMQTWDSIKDTPPRDPPLLNGASATVGGYAWNDAGNAYRLLDAGGRNQVLYVDKQQFPWHYWDGNCWPQDTERRVRKWMGDVLEAAYKDGWQSGQPRSVQTEEAKFLLASGNERNINGALARVADKVAITPNVFDTHDWFLPCDNGLTYDVRTGLVFPSLPEHYMSRCVPARAITEPEAHPKFDAMMQRLTKGDEALTHYLIWLLGLCLTGYTGEKCFWFWQGPTNAGKTTLLTLLARLGGPFVYCIPLKALLKQRQDTGILHDIAGIRGMRLVYAEEFKPGDVLDSAWVKKISGGGDITADRKGEPNITFRSTAKLIIGTNPMPVITDIDDAIVGRVRVVPFTANIPAVLKAAKLPLRSPDEAVDDLMDEAPAIVRTLVDTVAAWYQAGRGHQMPKAVDKASKKYTDAQDPLQSWMDTCCEHGKDGALTKRRVELPLKTWYWSFLKQSGLGHSNSRYQHFGEQLISKGFTKRDAYDGKRITGPALTAEAQNMAELEATLADAEELKRRS